MHIASFFLFFVTEQSRGFFLVQTGVRGKAEQRSRAAVRRIQAGAGSGPRERGDTAKRDICWPATAPRRPPGPSCLGEGRKPAFSHCHCVPDRFVNQLGSSSASHAGCRSSLTGEEEEGEEEEELQGEGQGQPSWASRAPAPFTPESCPRPACVPENQRQGGRNPPAAGAPGTQGLEKGFVNKEGEEEKKSQKENINSGIRRYTQLFIQQHRVRPAVCQEQWGRGEDDSEPMHVERCDAPAGSRCCGLSL
nr:PREDICTED: uncharacterized protein LOC103552660 isoform X2 [Equus przewalskii]